MNTLVVIPARSGSKGLKDKNIKPLNGKPLLFYSIDTAREVFSDNDLFISTDSVDYANLVKNKKRLNIPFLRPQKLASDSANTQDVLLHTLAYFEKQGEVYDAVMLLQPTSPFRKKEHLIEALKLYEMNKNCDMVVSVKETDVNPYYVLFEEVNGFLKKSKESNVTRRQDLPPVYEINGSIYIYNSESLKTKNVSEFDKIIKYKMAKEFSIDIDDQLYFDFASFMILNSFF